MSCSCCCLVVPSAERLEGTNRKKQLLVREEEEEEEEKEEEEEEDRTNMDISLLRAQYWSSRERQKRHTQVLLFRTVSEELSEAVSVVPFTQALTSSWEPNSSPPPALTSDPDPWHVHLDLHRRSRPAVGVPPPASSLETTNSGDVGSSRRLSSSSGGSLQESRGRKLSVGSTTDSRCSSVSDTNEEEDDVFDADTSRTDPVQASVPGSPEASEGNPREEDPPDVFVCSSFSESSAPVASSSSSSSASNLPGKEPANVQTGNGVLQSSTAAWRGSRFTRQLSVGGVGSSTGGQQNQNYYPFPNRKTPRISEAARRLGMYSSF
ncbi:uncharacterized protein LOC122972265 isoform X2 [Thunnus albacares]|uniref:uncharacterized protein LOC122972265 isoform X2 n=1 Tax=Thunnus albacares TaxID=8236 RepID=UPI001CF63196|nr:uncharacterized protein LOC122972265 isoform X2 [Thunnus albacares]